MELLKTTTTSDDSFRFSIIKKQRFCFLFATAALSCFVLGGCGSGDWVPVTGSVRYANQLLKTGHVSFSPVEGGRPAYGQIQPDGTFSLKTDGKDGAKVGKYYLGISTVFVNGGRQIEMTFRGPRDKPTELVPEKPNELAIDINEKDGGWTRSAPD